MKKENGKRQKIMNYEVNYEKRERKETENHEL
jgi:hypothetical protein